MAYPTTTTTTQTTVQTVSSDIATVAQVASAVAPLAGPYGLVAVGILQIVEVLANEAPAAYTVIAKAFDGTQKTAADFTALRAQVAALSLDS